jgi:uroporphyrin-3 C-methyltransferase
MDDSEPIASVATAAQPATRAPKRRAASRNAALLLALLIALLGAYGGYDLFKSQRALRTNLEARLAQSDAAMVEARARDVEFGTQMRDAQAKMALLETRLAETQAQQAALESLYHDLAPARDELAFIETEQLLNLASQQLSLAGNVRAAVTAMQLADAKLAGIERPQLVPLRRALARDLERLKAVPYVDVPGLAVKLDQTMAAIDALPLAQDERVPDAAGTPPAKDMPRWLAFWRDAWNDLKSLVRIEVTDRPAPPLVTPTQAYFLRENLRLRLLSARVALLSRDEATFRADVAAARAWIKQFFDLRNKQVQGVEATLAQLAATPMPTEVPDLAGSLGALRTAKGARDRAADKPGDRAATPAR